MKLDKARFWSTKFVYAKITLNYMITYLQCKPFGFIAEYTKKPTQKIVFVTSLGEFIELCTWAEFVVTRSEQAFCFGFDL